MSKKNRLELMGALHVLGLFVLDGGRSGKPSSVWALRKAHAWHQCRRDGRDVTADSVARFCTDPHPPGIDQRPYYGTPRKTGGAA